jgi:hypothetical protein
MFRKNERFSFSRKSNKSKSIKIKFHFIFKYFPSKIAWAMNKGVKDRFKDYWDADHGCTYIPYAELKDISNLTSIAEGGTIDEESVPSFLKRLFFSFFVRM